MKIIIAGTGSIGKRHVVNIKRIEPDAEFILIRGNSRNDEYSKSINAFVVSDLQQALEYSPDAFIIATPSSMHCEYILAGIEANIPMYIEKPLVTLREDVNRIKDTLIRLKYTAPSLSGCNLRFLPSLQMLRDALCQERVGSIARASFHVGQWLPDWRPDQDYKASYSAKSSMGGGVVYDLIHEFDAVRWLLGEFDNIKALIADYKPLDIDSESVACVIMGKKSGTPLVTVCLDYVARKLVRKYEFVGEYGTLTWDLTNKSLVIENQDNIETLSSKESDFDMSKTYMDAMKEFLDAIKFNTKTSQGIIEGIKTTELAMCVRESA